MTATTAPMPAATPPPQARVLDVGCDQGLLKSLLRASSSAAAPP